MSETRSMPNTRSLSVAAEPVRRAARPWWDFPQPVAIAIAVLAFLSVWQAVILTGIVPPIILPGPLDVAEQIVVVGQQLISGDGFLARQLGYTVQEVFAGFAIAVTVGFSAGLWIGLTNFGQRAVLPLFVLLEATPKIAFAPVFIAWFGFGMTSKIVLAAFLSLFPVLIGTVSGLRATTEDELRLFRSLRAGRWQVLWKLRLMRALPFIFAGFKIAIVSSVTGAVAAEFIGGGMGFGEQIRIAGTRLDLARVFALIAYLSILGLLLFGLVSKLQSIVTFWDGAGTGRPRRRRRRVARLLREES